MAYQCLLPDDYLASLRPEDRAAHYAFEDPSRPATLIGLVSGVILGFATIGRSQDADAEGHGELLALYVDPSAWGGGLGRSLMAAARRGLIDQGFREALLWVLVGNARAERFYRRDGWSPDGSERRTEIWGIEVNEIRYRRQLV
jgi:GNAT superfamily N-acetyltransferase